MLDPERYFDNLFDSPRITTLRLYNCCLNTQNVMTAANKGGEFTEFIGILAPLTSQLGTELGDVASSIAEQKGGTFTNNEVLASFKLIMSSKEGVIRDALGSKHSAGYLMFYPQGISQYSNATKTTMPVLVQAVYNAAEKYKADLSPSLVQTLQSFVKSWTESRTDQQELKGDVKNNIADKSGLRESMQIALTQVVHGIAYKYPGAVATCLSFFDFAMLYPPAHHKGIVKKGDVPAGKTVTALNKTLEETTKISIHNPSDNAPVAAWLAADENEPYTGKGVVVQPGKTTDKHAPELGDLKNTFLRVINLSDVNDGSYDIEID